MVQSIYEKAPRLDYNPQVLTDHLLTACAVRATGPSFSIFREFFVFFGIIFYWMEIHVAVSGVVFH